MTQNYAGLDYSFGKANFNPETGIHFGVISQNSIMPEAMEDVEYDYGKPTCGKCGGSAIESGELPAEFEDAEWNEGKDYACVTCKRCFWSDTAFPDMAIGWSYGKDGYNLTDCLTNDVFVLDSPFYTRAQYCSPCVPGAGNLDNPCEDGPKTYCLGHDWFEGGKAPYQVFKVADDTEVVEQV
jgi:hypothetical protein